MEFQWQQGFERVPDEEWVHKPPDSLALKYDTVESHGWYGNLETTLDQLQEYLQPGAIMVDYSGGTGILVDRLLNRLPDLQAGFIIIDSSPKFLRLALEKLGGNHRVAFRWIRYLKKERRLQLPDEVLPLSIMKRGVDAVVSTNAIHLYYDLADTLRSWVRILRPGHCAFVQSGNIRNPSAPPGDWIIDETVENIHRVAMEIVRNDEEYSEYRSILEDPKRMKKYDELRGKYFLPVRPLDFYLCAFGEAGFSIESVETRSIVAKVSEWYDFLSVYSDGVLGWVGGVERIEGQKPLKVATRTRLALMKQAMSQLFEGQDSFQASWTYIVCRRP